MTRREQYADFDQLNVVDYLIVVWKSRGFLIGFCGTAVVSALVFSLLSPNIFDSTVTILPPAERNAGIGMSAEALLGKASVLVPGLPAFTGQEDILVTVLESRSLAEKIVDKYQLVNYYKVGGPDRAVAALRNATTVSVSKAGLISITVEDRDPRMAAELANAHAAELDVMLKRMDFRENSAKRRFILDRLAETQGELRSAEEALMRFQEENSAVALPEQAEGVINAAAQLKAQIMAAEVELQVARNYATESNPSVVRLKQKIGELKKQLAREQYGRGLDLPSIDEAASGARSNRYKEIHLAAASVPKLGLQFTRLTRDLKVHETVYTFLTQQLEDTKIAESRDILAAQVLDPAIPPRVKSRPKTILNVILAGALSLILGIVFVFLGEYIDMQKARLRAQ